MGIPRLLRRLCQLLQVHHLRSGDLRCELHGAHDEVLLEEPRGEEVREPVRGVRQKGRI